MCHQHYKVELKKMNTVGANHFLFPEADCSLSSPVKYRQGASDG